MVALGLFLVLLCGLLTVAVVLQNTDAAHAAVFGQGISGLTLGGLFVAGLITGVIALAGIGLALGGARRRRAKRVALKHQVREVHSERESLAEENARLQAELEASRNGYATADGVGRTAALDSGDVYPNEAATRHHSLFRKD